jgi:hypothetical protein
LACAGVCAAEGVWDTPIKITIVRIAQAIGLDESMDLQLWRSLPPRPTEYIPQNRQKETIQYKTKENDWRQ